MLGDYFALPTDTGTCQIDYCTLVISKTDLQPESLVLSTRKESTYKHWITIRPDKTKSLSRAIACYSAITNNDGKKDFIVSNPVVVEFIAVDPCVAATLVLKQKIVPSGGSGPFTVDIKMTTFTEVLFASRAYGGTSHSKCGVNRYLLVEADPPYNAYAGSVLSINELNGEISAAIAPTVLTERARVMFQNSSRLSVFEYTNEFTLEIRCGTDST